MPPIEPIEAEQIEVVYEKGVLRPVHPLDLAEGTGLEVTVTTVMSGTDIAPSTSSTSSTPSVEQEQADGADGAEVGEVAVAEATYVAFLKEPDNIVALPLQSEPQPHTVRNHDAILYPKQGTMP